MNVQRNTTRQLLTKAAPASAAEDARQMKTSDSAARCEASEEAAAGARASGARSVVPEVCVRAIFDELFVFAKHIHARTQKGIYIHNHMHTHTHLYTYICIFATLLQI